MRLEPDPRLSRRRFLRALAYCGIAATASAAMRPLRANALPAGGGYAPSSISEMEFDVTYRTEVTSLPARARSVRVWLPLPPPDAWQDVLGLSVRSDRPYEVRRDPLYGNRIAHVSTDAAAGPFMLEARYRIVRRRAGGEKVDLTAGDAKSKYLRLVDPVRVTDEVRAFAERVVGQERRPSMIGRKVYDAVIELLAYDKDIPGCGIGDTTWVMKYKRGKCDDYHALFLAMMVAHEVPVRWEQGFPLPYPATDAEKSGGLSGDCTGAHCWASFYDREIGWIPVDVSEADKRPELRDFFYGHLTPNRFKVSEGRGIRLDPVQGGDPLPTFAFAYAEADGLPLIYPANYNNQIRYVITRVRTDDATESG